MSSRNLADPSAPSLPAPRDAAKPKRREALLDMLGLAAGVSGMAGRSAHAAAASNAPSVPAAGAPAGPRRIDVHHHYIPPKYRSALEAVGQSKPSGMPGIPKWSVEDSLAMMDRNGIETAVLSVVNGVNYGDDAAARDLARYVNEEGARAVSAHPRRFGLFASLPLPDVDGSLKEIDYVFDTLHADGIVLSSNFRGIYLGDARFEPVFAQLNRRNANVFIHPFNPFCPYCQDPAELPPLGYPFPMIEFMFETARTVFNMLLSGTTDKFPNVKFIVPHAGAGGVLPALTERVAAVSSLLKIGPQQDATQFRRKLRGLYYDLAGWPEPVGLPALLQIADPSHILYGSDWPFTPEFLGTSLVKSLDASVQITPAMRRAFMRENALALFPRFGRS